jgi:hypothetical protein
MTPEVFREPAAPSSEKQSLASRHDLGTPRERVDARCSSIARGLATPARTPAFAAMTDEIREMFGD